MRSSAYFVNDNDDNLVSAFDESTFSGDRVYDIFDNEYENIAEDYIVWVNTNKYIW